MSQPPNDGPQGNPQQPYPHNDGQQYPPNNQYGYGQPPKKKRKKWPWILGILVLLAILLFGGCAALIGGAMNAAEDATNAPATSEPTAAVAAPTAAAETPAASDPEATKAGKTVTLKATSTGDGMVAFGNTSTQSSQSFSGEWSQDLTLEDWVDAATLSVSSATMGGDSEVTCEIIYEGATVVENTSSGELASASCTAASAELK